jgi:hypothetical protein
LAASAASRTFSEPVRVEPGMTNIFGDGITSPARNLAAIVAIVAIVATIHAFPRVQKTSRRYCPR